MASTLAARQEAAVPSPGTDHSWRKRPAQMTVATSQPPKRLKTSDNSSDPASGEHPPSAESVKTPIGQKDARGRRNAERWFNDINEHPKKAPFVDNDPPYYMQKNTSSDENIPAKFAPPSQRWPAMGPQAPTRSLLAQMDAHNDNTDDFRSVIDDLTIQNKKLKKKLRKYEKLHCSHLQEEKLFEVRVHGLAANRKRELEETLRSFASSITADSPPAKPDIPEPKKPSALGLDPAYKPSSSSTSLSKPQDSGYASMSGQTGASASNQLDQQPAEGATQTKRQNVRSYLHDIPENLAPKPMLAMSDRAKTKLVVRRLEQLFTGKGVARSRQQQSRQQQEVSDSAAQADRHQIEAGGRRVWQEGTREAHILPGDADLQIDSMEDAGRGGRRSHGSNEGSRSRSTLDSQNSDSPRSPEQRPTRPLDLDIHRAQVPSDNMDYIRHLGVVSPSAEASEDFQDDGWVYLNLLTSMAQLHTLNVTTDFIRKALSSVSEKFELSSDGTKVRWLGGNDGTKMSSESGESDEPNHSSTEPSLTPSKRGSFAEFSSKDEVQGANAESSAPPQAAARRRLVNLQEPSTDTSKFHYKPLFFHAAESEGSEETGLHSDDLSSSEEQDFTTGVNSGSNARRDREAKLRGRRRDDGPIIFYNRARFCTDLSGDVHSGQRDHATYSRLTEQPLGCESDGPDDAHGQYVSKSPSTQTSGSLDAPKKPLSRSALDLEDLKSSISDCMSSGKSATAMEASGLGGVRPEDNFVVRVQVRHAGKKKPPLRKLTAFSKPKGPIRKVLHNLTQETVDAFLKGGTSPTPQRAFESEIVSSVKTTMAPSALPPPSYVFRPFNSSDSDQEEEEDEEDDSDNIDHDAYPAFPQPNAPQPQQYRPYPRQVSALRPNGNAVPPRTAKPPGLYRNDSALLSSSSSSKATTGDSDESSSIDLLAHARELEPDFIAAREREFERQRQALSRTQSVNSDALRARAGAAVAANMPVPVPAGSSAATAGGGSVVGSPIFGRGVEVAGKKDRNASEVEKRGREEEEDEEGSDADSMSVDRNSESSAE